MIINGKIKIGEELGRGSFATVFKATIVGDYPPLKTGDVVAVKSISTIKFSTKQEREKLENEITLMQKMQHENIVKLYGVERTKKTYFLIMEFCESGDLHQYIRKFKDGLSEDMIFNFSSQIGKGLEYLQSKEIVHRDLKPQNIMMRGRWPDLTLKIADFGFARFLHQNDLAETICGSPIYMAPEIQFNAPYTAAVDMWSLGVILYELATTKPPFPNCKTTYELTNEIKQLGSRPIQIPSYIKVSKDYKDLVSKLLVVDPHQRMNLSQYLEHQFFKNQPNTDVDIVDDKSDKRKQKFSFLSCITLSNSESPDKVLQLVKEVADTIEGMFTDCQDRGEAVLFDLLKTMCEFLFDILNECKTQGSCELEDDILELIEGYKNEAVKMSETKMEEPQLTAIQFLFEKAKEFVKSGIDAEKEDDLSYAHYQFRKAANVLCPLIFLKGRNEETTQIRKLYDQLIVRCTQPVPEDSLAF